MTSPVVPISGAVPGWYPDPWNNGSLRWWDGAAWTEHVSAAWAPPAPTARPMARNDGIEYLVPVNTDGWAIASGYLGLFSLIPNPFTSVAAIACGLVAMQRIKQTGKHGKGRAIVGLAFGGLSLAVFALILVASAGSSQG